MNKKHRIFYELTDDRTWQNRKLLSARDNGAVYCISSARARDEYNEYMDEHGQYPTAKWLNTHIWFGTEEEWREYNDGRWPLNLYK